jgi:hypothetical protein
MLPCTTSESVAFLMYLNVEDCHFLLASQHQPFLVTHITKKHTREHGKMVKQQEGLVLSKQAVIIYKSIFIF